MSGDERISQLRVASRAAPALRHLPLASVARDQDLAWRPIYAVWEITLKCDLACRHCGSRAGRVRPDELTTTECLDLVEQMAALVVLEVTLIGGEAYLRDDWLQIVRAIRKAGMQCSMTTGGRGLTAERARAGAESGLQSSSVSLDGRETTHDHLRGVVGSYRSALMAARNLRAASVGLSVNTQINRLSMTELPDVLEKIIALGARAWQIQLTVAIGRAADQPALLLQPEDMLELFPLLGILKIRCDQSGGRRFGPSQESWPSRERFVGVYSEARRSDGPGGNA
ncbi:MAG TPA: radical SAM protein [Polyangia bacterium]|nr:radical SAM protein [Polyangia bacterium]